MSKRILEGIPAMTYGNPSAVCYIGAVMRLMEAIDDPIAQDELFALSGVGLCFPWALNSCCDEVSVIGEIPDYTFKVLGYKSTHIKPKSTNENTSLLHRIWHKILSYKGARISNTLGDKAACFRKIKKSIDRGVPVIGFGITTKQPYACLITGYDDGGVYTRSCWPPEGAKSGGEAHFYSPDWHENCAGLLLVGKKTGERLSGKAAYDQLEWWARNYRWKRKDRGYKNPVTAQGKEIHINEDAFNAMIEWLKDDAQWGDPNADNKEQYIKQCGLLLFAHYRRQLHEYLKKLDRQCPGLVNPATLGVLERIGTKFPGAHRSDLWLHEIVDPALADFSSMKDPAVREKMAQYVRELQGDDNSLQWTLFMPQSVERRINRKWVRERFEYVKLGKVRFIGIDATRTGEKRAALWARSEEFLPKLDALMGEYAAGITDNCVFIHHNGNEFFEEEHALAGRFFKADTPVPKGFDFYDVPTTSAAYALYSVKKFNNGYAYDLTRDQILGEDICIPYPESYWHAEVYTNGLPKKKKSCRFGYLFSVDFCEAGLRR